MKITEKLVAMIVISMILSACGKNSYPVPENSIRNKIGGASFGVDLSLEGKEGTVLEVNESKLMPELKNYITENFDTEKHDFFVQVDTKKGVTWIDYKNEEIQEYESLATQEYPYISGGLVSPKGRYLAVVRTKGENEAWSELLIIDTEKQRYFIPLDDDALLSPDESSGCKEVVLIDKRNKDSNSCDVEKPSSVYLMDFWSTDSKVEVVKMFPSSSLIYTIDMEV